MGYHVFSKTRTFGTVWHMFGSYREATDTAHDLVEAVRTEPGPVLVAVHGPRGRIWSYETNPSQEPR